jgi:hypothetical protein
MLESQFPAAQRGDKVLLATVSSTGGVLGTLNPFGTPTTGWRIVQDDNIVYEVINAVLSGHGGTWARDDVAVDAWRCWYSPTAHTWNLDYAAAAANPITWVNLSVLSSLGVLTLLGKTVLPKNRVSTNPGNTTTTTTSLTLVSTGLGVGPITPVYLAALKVLMGCMGGNGTAGDGMQLAIYRNTTGIPVGGTAVGGDTRVWLGSSQTTPASAANSQSWSAAFEDTGVVVATAYYYYVAFAAITAGTVTALYTSMVVEE